MGVFQQGLSGLITSQKSLEVTANNVANANTVGFKGSNAIFGDVYANTLSRADAGLAVGGGVKLAAIRQEFRQGNVVTTQNPLDLAISGNGFFKVKDSDGAEYLTRNGQFGLDRDNNVVTASGKNLLAFPLDATTGKVLDTAQPLNIPTKPIPPKATTTTTIKLNLDSRETPKPATPAFNLADPNTYNFNSSVVVRNQLGEPQSLQVYWRREDTGASTNNWQVFASMNGTQVNIRPKATQLTGTTTVPALATGAPMTFNPNGTLLASTGATDFPGQFEIEVPNAAPFKDFNSTAVDIITLDMRESTQFGNEYQIQDLKQNGYDAANFVNFTIDGQGTLSLNFANGESINHAKIALFRYRNPEGLQPVGDNNWVQTLQAGPEFASNAGSAGFGAIQAGAVEEANVDLTTELVEMIATQRVYQANSKSIQAQDTLLQTVTNLT
jgi:flagellar hook protein FlgE